MLTRNHIFDFVENYFIIPICSYIEDKSFEYDIGTPESDKYWNLAQKIQNKFIRFEIQHGYKVTPKPVPKWLRNGLMIQCDLDEDDMKAINNYWETGKIR